MKWDGMANWEIGYTLLSYYCVDLGVGLAGTYHFAFRSE